MGGTDDEPRQGPCAGGDALGDRRDPRGSGGPAGRPGDAGRGGLEWRGRPAGSVGPGGDRYRAARPATASLTSTVVVTISDGWGCPDVAALDTLRLTWTGPVGRERGGIAWGTFRRRTPAICTSASRTWTRRPPTSSV
ncbi:hypothetical protein FHG89_00850 [Micromonospora orduensis]|uniref:Uncharacterized protein n=1 Tax=Micromonospora orduensis TaxID=1420891 RepID=A0A5C4R069_9ACTN|nr:hypothetical protein FHG89_00850 [Micromonospora orduensis]